MILPNKSGKPDFLFKLNLKYMSTGNYLSNFSPKYVGSAWVYPRLRTLHSIIPASLRGTSSFWFYNSARTNYVMQTQTLVLTAPHPPLPTHMALLSWLLLFAQRFMHSLRRLRLLPACVIEVHNSFIKHIFGAGGRGPGDAQSSHVLCLRAFYASFFYGGLVPLCVIMF